MTEKVEHNRILSLFGCCSAKDDSSSQILIKPSIVEPQKLQTQQIPATQLVTPLTRQLNSRIYSSPIKTIRTEHLSPMNKENLSNSVKFTPGDALRAFQNKPVNVVVTPQTSQLKTQPVVYQRIIQQQPQQFTHTTHVQQFKPAQSPFGSQIVRINQPISQFPVTSVIPNGFDYLNKQTKQQVIPKNDA